MENWGLEVALGFSMSAAVLAFCRVSGWMPVDTSSSLRWHGAHHDDEETNNIEEPTILWSGGVETTVGLVVAVSVMAAVAAEIASETGRHIIGAASTLLLADNSLSDSFVVYAKAAAPLFAPPLSTPSLTFSSPPASLPWLSWNALSRKQGQMVSVYVWVIIGAGALLVAYVASTFIKMYLDDRERRQREAEGGGPYSSNSDNENGYRGYVAALPIQTPNDTSRDLHIVDLDFRQCTH
ncbi:hypothetical protein PC123_g23434 [Phytophthora cactorum]|nr:hypothetical protein PC123_g23434 [Phytophthora cactorum]